ncbi:UNVERIFIED_CONTAM: hypothetical protein FKN15_000870 [Acipenser sinensis]
MELTSFFTSYYGKEEHLSFNRAQLAAPLWRNNSQLAMCPPPVLCSNLPCCRVDLTSCLGPPTSGEHLSFSRAQLAAPLWRNNSQLAMCPPPVLCSNLPCCRVDLTSCLGPPTSLTQSSEKLKE